MAKHTPGPWSADPPDRHEPYWIVHAAAGVGGVIAEVCSCPRPEAERDPSEVEANARLMAAAPAMLASLEETEARIAFLARRAAWHDHILETYATSGMGEELKGLLDRAWDDMEKGGRQ